MAQVFSNTVHGVVAPKKQLQKHFPGLSVEQICEEILRKGSLQVSAKEREAETDKLMAEVTNLVASMCIDAATGARLAPDAVGRLLRDDAGFAPSTTSSSDHTAIHYYYYDILLRHPASACLLVIFYHTRATCRVA